MFSQLEITPIENLHLGFGNRKEAQTAGKFVTITLDFPENMMVINLLGAGFLKAKAPGVIVEKVAWHDCDLFGQQYVYDYSL